MSETILFPSPAASTTAAVVMSILLLKEFPVCPSDNCSATPNAQEDCRLQGDSGRVMLPVRVLSAADFTG